MIRLLFLFAAAALVSAQTYHYDAAGRITSAVWPNGRAIDYTYDASDNLVSARPANAPPAPGAVSATQTGPNSNRLSWTPSGPTPAGWTLQRRAPGGDWQTVTTLPGAATTYLDAGTNGIAYEYRLAATASGRSSAWSRSFLPSSPARVEMPVAQAGAAALNTLGAAPGVKGGYITLDLEEGSVPYGTAVFTLVQNGATVSEAAVPASPPTTHARLFIEQRNGVTAALTQFLGAVNITTGIGIANPGDQPAELDLVLRDAQGLVVTSARGALPARNHTALLLSELNTIAPGFNVPASFAAGAGIGSLDITSDVPVSVMALRATINQRNEILFTSTPVADLTLPVPAGAQVFPHLADGGGFTTALALVNPADLPLSGTIEFFASNGGPLPVAPRGGAPATTTRYLIPPNGAWLLESDGRLETRAGWIRLIPDGAQGAPFGAGVFRLGQNGAVVSESGVPAQALTPSSRVFIDRTAGRDTGVALANPSNVPVNVTLRAYALDGITPVTPARVVILPARGHLAAVSGDLVGALPDGFTGVLAIESPAPVAALALRFLVNERSELIMMTLPVADLTRPAPWPVVFPHIADGGGFRTQILLLGPASASLSVASFFDSEGQPLPVADLPR